MLDEKKRKAEEFVEDHEGEIILGGSTVLGVLTLIGVFVVYKRAIASGVRDGILQAASK